MYRVAVEDPGRPQHGNRLRLLHRRRLRDQPRRLKKQKGEEQATNDGWHPEIMP
jgi:hypothetical protein